MDNRDHKEWSDATALMGAVLARQDEPWRLIYALMDDVYGAYWRNLRGSGGPIVSRIDFIQAWGRYSAQQINIWVSTERRCGASWQKIGDALGMTKQAVQQRFGVKRS
ncbi:hypothetical protein ABH924_005078 [Arthrobacter sp. GAS37]|uniref:hypothetical protein n=1 Tax=Arthrobacter sp. GAS37 TaxID=3156261 RepID=UPI00383805BD